MISLSGIGPGRLIVFPENSAVAILNAVFLSCNTCLTCCDSILFKAFHVPAFQIETGLSPL